MGDDDRVRWDALPELAEEAEPIAAASCEMGEIRLYEDRLAFRASMLQVRLGRGVPDQDIAYHRIATIEWQRPAFWRMGHLRITLADRPKRSETPAAVSFPFQTWERPAFEALHAELERRVEAARAAGAGIGSTGAGTGSTGPGTGSTGPGEQPASPAGATGATDIPAQIRELGRLRDEGLLSEDEFQAKKQDLLARM